MVEMGHFGKKFPVAKRSVVFALQCFRISSRYSEMPVCFFQMLLIKLPFFLILIFFGHPCSLWDLSLPTRD